GDKRPPAPEVATAEDIERYNLQWARQHGIETTHNPDGDAILYSKAELDEDTRHRAEFPWLYDPSRGIRWDFDPIALRNLAQGNTWVGMLVQSITKEIAETLEKFYKSGMEGPAPLVDFIILRIPVPGAERLMPVFGVSDWIAAAFLSAAAFRFGVRDNLVGPEPREGRPVDFFLPAASAGLLAALFLAWTIDRFVPALPVVVVVFLLVTALRRPARLRPTREDWKLLGGAVDGSTPVKFSILSSAKN
ncbi:MAG: hypothetical protein ACLFTV_17505, partial [Desulfococcaceae bacterium]